MAEIDWLGLKKFADPSSSLDTALSDSLPFGEIKRQLTKQSDTSVDGLK
jgi:hypothetical protein